MRACIRTPHPRPSRACPRYQHTTTDKPGTKSHSRGEEGGTARHLQAGEAVPECTIRQSVTIGAVPAQCSLQPTIPYAPKPCFHIDLAVSEPAALPVQFGSDKRTKHAPPALPRVPPHLLARVVWAHMCTHARQLSTWHSSGDRSSRLGPSMAQVGGRRSQNLNTGVFLW